MLRFALICLIPFAIAGQDASLSVAGSVVDAQSGQPLAHALVSLRGFVTAKGPSHESTPQRIDRSALTDAGGTFRFSILPPGSYSVLAQKPGYAFGAAAGSRLGSSAIDLQSSVDVRVALSAYGDISGKVVDDHGEPMRGVTIYALISEIVDGLKQTRRTRNVTTDDRGRYRIWNLAPGKYYLKAVGQGGANVVTGAANSARLDVGDSFAPIYFAGGRTAASARPVEIASGTHVMADFQLKIEPAWRIHATLQNFDPRQQVTFSFAIDGEEFPAGPDRVNTTTGAIEFKDVVSGNYVLRAAQGKLRGEVAVNVAGADTENVSLALYPPVDIPVSVRFTNPVPQAPARAAKRPRTSFVLPTADDDDDDTDADGSAEYCSVSLRPAEINGSSPGLNPSERMVCCMMFCPESIGFPFNVSADMSVPPWRARKTCLRIL